MRKRIGEYLIQAGLLTEEDFRTALAEHKRTGERLGAVLVRLNFATEKQTAQVLAFQFGFPYADLTENPPDPVAVVLIPKDVALKYVCVGVSLERSVLTVAMADPLLFSVVQDLEIRIGCRIKQIVATPADILNAIQIGDQNPEVGLTVPAGSVATTTQLARATAPGADRSPGKTARTRSLEEDVFEPLPGPREHGEASSIIDLVNLVLKGAIANRASDVHVEPMEQGIVIRHRLDGFLKEVMRLPNGLHEGLIERLKTMAGMDVAERRLPQDGRLRASAINGRHVDFRVSTLHTLFGEKVVLRLLDRRERVPDLAEIGMSPAALEELRRFLEHRHGLIMVVGPTGSGKTTTLSAALRAVQPETTNVVTIEDPIEYQIPGVNQAQVDETIELTFARALRAILRQDPDVILVGEVRDAETANLAMEAARTGRLVLSALHTDDAASCVTRLMDIGIEPYVVASALVGVVAQRLVRRLCGNCRRPYAPSGETLNALNVSEAEAATISIYRSGGCDQCNHTGYRGRIGIYEVMRVTDTLRRLIAARTASDQIRDAAIAGGMVSLGEDGLAKVKNGDTTPEELLREVKDLRETRTLCRGCGSAVAVDFVACPRCGKRLGAGCPYCGRALQPGWHFCPYCARSIEVKLVQSSRGHDGQEARPRNL